MTLIRNMWQALVGGGGGGDDSAVDGAVPGPGARRRCVRARRRSAAPSLDRRGYALPYVARHVTGAKAEAWCLLIHADASLSLPATSSSAFQTLIS